MKNRKASILTAILAVILLFTSGCGTNNQPDNTHTTESTAAPQTTQVSADLEEKTVPDIGTSTSVSEESSSSAEETTLEEESSVSAAPMGTADIVALFNESANKIKTDAKKVVKNYEKRTVNEDKVSIPSAIESAAKSMMNSLMKDDTEPTVYATREEIMTEYLVPDQSYVSRLDPAYVVKATCTDNGKEYEIYLKLKNQTNPTAGVGVGAVCDVIEAAEVAEGAPFVEKFTTEYYNCEIKATIDKATGKITHTNYKTPLVLSITVNMFGTHDASVGFTFEKDYTITY